MQGIGDAFDLGWKLAATIKSNTGPFVLDSYEQERRPVALMSIQRSGIHMETHLALAGLLGHDPHLVEKDTEEGRALRQKIHDHYQTNSGENTDVGVEMDHRHKSCVYPRPSEAENSEPPWNPEHYLPSTFVGSRAPHVFLKDGSAIFDYFGEYWTFFEFATEDTQTGHSQTILNAAKDIRMPVKHVVLRDEEHARNVWQARLVLVRPDGHVAWRGEEAPDSGVASEIVAIIAGHKAGGFNEIESDDDNASAIKKPFAATSTVTSQVEDYKLEQMGIMQS